MKFIWPLAMIIIAFISCKTKTTQENTDSSFDVMTFNASAQSSLIEYPATIEGGTDIEIRPQVSGILEEILVDEGDYVKKGQPLFRINGLPFIENLRTAQGREKAMEGSVANAQLEVDKQSTLVENKVVSDYQLRAAKSNLQIALAGLEQARADVAAARIQLSYTSVKAPSNGYVGLFMRKQGSLVGPTDPNALTTLSDNHELHVYFSLSERDFDIFKEQYSGTTIAEKIQHVPPVELVLSSKKVYDERGKIDLVDGQFDKGTGAITLRASFPNEKAILRSGNTGKIRMKIQYPTAFRIPQSATIELQDKVMVYAVGADNKVKRKVIHIIGKDDDHYLVDDGLENGEAIVLTGFSYLSEGATIKPKLITYSSAKSKN